MSNLHYFTLALLIVWSPSMGARLRMMMVAFYMMAGFIEVIK